MAISRIILLSAVTLLLVCSCGYSKIYFSKIKTTFNPTPKNLISSSPEKGFLVTGNVVGEMEKDVSLAVVAITRWETEWRIVGYTIIPGGGSDLRV